MPSASQYTEIRRLQSMINGRSANPTPKRGPSMYSGFAGQFISGLPANVLRSNKFTSVSAPPRMRFVDGETPYYLEIATNLKYEEESGETLIGYDGTITDLTSLVIPEGVTSISTSAFEDCNNLVTITMPIGLTSIGSRAFFGCYALTSLTIPNTVQTIGATAFKDCGELISLSISNRVTIINDNTFSGCSKLTSLTIPSGVTEIGVNAFSGCSKLASLTIPSTVVVISNSAFSGCAELLTLTIPTSMRTIRALAFNGCIKLHTLTILNGVTFIGNGAFYLGPGAGVLKTTGVTNGSVIDVLADDNRIFGRDIVA